MAIFNIPLPPPLYFFLGQNYSENVFEFVNHFDSPYPSTFAGKFTLCQKTVLPGSSYNLLSCQGLSGWSWGLTALGTQHRWPRGKAGQESKPQHLLGSDGLCDTAQTHLPLWLPWKSPSPVTPETERGIRNQPPSKREFLIRLWFPDIREVLRVLVLLEKYCIQHQAPESSRCAPWGLGPAT